MAYKFNPFTSNFDLVDEGFWLRDFVNGYIYQKVLTDKVGIGTDSPTEELEVSGNIKLTADNDKLYQGAGDDYSQYFDGTNQNFDLTSGDFVFNSDLRLSTGQSIYTDLASLKFYTNTDKFAFRVLDTFSSGWVDDAGGAFLQLSSTSLRKAFLTAENGNSFLRLGISSNGTTFSEYGYSDLPIPLH